MKRAVIFGASPLGDWNFVSPYLCRDDLIICADGGLNAAKMLGLHPDWYVGDSDSGGCAGTLPADLLPSEKDVTDLDMAVSRALAEGADLLLLCGCTGGREDHHLSAVGQLERIYQAGKIGMIVDPYNEITLLTPGRTILPIEPEYTYFGLVPLDRVLKDVTISGAKYEIQNTDLHRASSLGVSNEQRAGIPCIVDVGDGIGLLIRSKEIHK